MLEAAKEPILAVLIVDASLVPCEFPTLLSHQLLYVPRCAIRVVRREPRGGSCLISSYMTERMSKLEQIGAGSHRLEPMAGYGEQLYCPVLFPKSPQQQAFNESGMGTFRHHDLLMSRDELNEVVHISC